MEGKVYLNGRLVGFYKDPKQLAEALREKRRTGKIPPTVSVSYNEETNELYVYTDEGRIIRPLIVVKDGKPLLTEKHIKDLKEGNITWDDLLREGIIEYLDPEEEENALIAESPEELTPEHTHLEIHGVAILAYPTTIIPWTETNLTTRSLHGAKMAKQSLSFPLANIRLRPDTRNYLLHYPEKPLVYSKTMKYSHYFERPEGQNYIVAVLSYEGYNIMDAVIMNKGSIERGLGRASFFRVYEAVERRYPGGQRDRIEIPDEETTGYLGEEVYHALGEDGLANVEAYVKGGDVLVGKTSPPRFLEEVSEFGIIEERRRESSVTLRPDEEGYVDSVMITTDENGNRLVKVKVREPKIPEIGDKFAARCGQKGVVGLIVPDEDMPYTEDGVRPDLILNPHAIPSRMTVSFLLELLGAKAAALRGKEVDATPFEGEREKAFEEILVKYGFRYDGTEVLYDGRTGRMLRAKIFIGPVYYRRLHHLVSHKYQGRARGPVQVLTRQPTEGRAREGGIRFGEMERECLLGHGAAMALYERLVESSDKVTEWVCEKCGVVAVNDIIRHRRYCPICGGTNVHPVEISYAFKLLLDELKSLGIYPKLVIGDKA